MPHFVVVEDDHMQREPLEGRLRETFPGARVDALVSESEFRAALPELRRQVPDLVVMDVMVRWEIPRQGMSEPPPDVLAGGYFRAGLRCAQLLHDDPALRPVPVILYTILELSDLERDRQVLPANTSYLGKNTDIEALLRLVRQRLRDRGRLRR